ncbi:MAG: glycosyltransferase [Acidobacteria bacterium]|nr:glycosyltransferase [Acidobacteriota bacterium]MCA1619915.1 glycosyltransferase [Acidobacteriota bacterium]
MKRKPFSIVIPTYNCGRKLANTLNSVLSQPRELYEIIVVDGGSGGETLSVIEEYSKDLRFVSEPDRGVYDALNKGVGMSSGRHLLFLGAGDILKGGVLERVAEILPEGEPSFAYGDAYLIRHNVRQGGTFGRKDFVGRNLCQQAIFYERQIFDLLGGFDLKYKVYADWAFNMKCFADARVRKLYLGLLVADFEGWGISDVQEDLAFKRDLPRLVRKHVGVDEYLRFRMYLARVSFYTFRHKLAGSVRAALPASLLRRQRP